MGVMLNLFHLKKCNIVEITLEIDYKHEAWHEVKHVDHALNLT